MSQKALFIPEKNGQWTLEERPIPKPGAGQVLVKNEAVALNPIDWKAQTLGLYVQEFPIIVGTDIAGVVEEVGSGVTSIAKGDRIVFQGSWVRDNAGFQQYTLVVADLTAKIPSNISFEQAATVPVAATAAVVGLYTKKGYGAELISPFEPSGRGAYAGKPIFILGGATSVGQYVIQFAKLSGFSPIIVSASTKHEAYLKSLGATHVIDRHTPAESLQGAIAKITTKTIDLIYDSVSLEGTQKTAYSLLPKGGQLIVVLKPLIEVEEGKGLTHTLGVVSMPHARELGVQFFRHITSLLQDGTIKPNRLELVSGGLPAIGKALDRLKNDQVSGKKLVIHPQEGL